MDGRDAPLPFMQGSFDFASKGAALDKAGSPTDVKVNLDGVATQKPAPSDNHLRLPKPLWQLRLPRADGDKTAEFLRAVSPSRLRKSNRGCSLFWWMRRRRRRSDARPMPAARENRTGTSSTAHTTHASAKRLDAPGREAPVRSQVQAPPAAGKLRDVDVGVSPMKRGVLRSPFLGGMRSVSRDRPGRLVQKRNSSSRSVDSNCKHTAATSMAVSRGSAAAAGAGTKSPLGFSVYA